jgi:hypothetical protein
MVSAVESLLWYLNIKIVIKLNTENYKGTTLLSNMHKILSNKLLCRQTLYVDKITGDHHCCLQCDIELMMKYSACMTHEKNGNTAIFRLQESLCFKREICVHYTHWIFIQMQLLKLIKIYNDTYSDVWMDKHFSDMLPVQRDTLSPQLFKLCFTICH